MGGKSSGQVIGYRYYLSVLMALSHGPLDAILQIIVGERSAWQGGATSTGTIAIDAPDLFGGDMREGGVQGYVDVMMGAADQPTNDYIAGQVNSGADQGTTTTYTLVKSHDTEDNTYYTVTKTAVDSITGVSTSVQLIQTVEPGTPEAEAVANTYFVRNASTTVVTDAIADTTTWTTVIQAGHIPAFRDIATLLFRGPTGGVLDGFPALGDLTLTDGPTQMSAFLWSSLNPNFKSPWVRCRRILKGWKDDSPWYPEKAAIGQLGNQVADQINSEPWRWAELPQDDFMFPTFDDTAAFSPPWSTGIFPAAAQLIPGVDPGYPNIFWQAQADDGTNRYYQLGLRKKFTLSAVTGDLKVRATGALTAAAILYCNGTRIAAFPPDPSTPADPAQPGLADGIINIPASVLKAGENLLAVSANGTRHLEAGDYRWKFGVDTGSYISQSAAKSAYDGEQASVSTPDYKFQGSNFLSTGDPFPDDQKILAKFYRRDLDTIVSVELSLVSSIVVPLNQINVTIPTATTSSTAVAVDMNPAHIIYQAMTDPKWGMGYDESSFDQDVWKASADTLYVEQFGLSLRWTNQTTIQDFVKSIINHINGVIRLNLLTGLFELKLIRGDYSIGDLVNLNPSNSNLKSYRKTAWADVASEVVVKYTTRDANPTSVAVQDLAAIQAQGGVVSVTREYSGIRDANLAQRVAMRDLNLCASQLTKVSMTCNRQGWGLAEGDVFSLTWPERGVGLVPFRILKLSNGALATSEIEIEAIEDVFGMPSAVYSTKPNANWVNPVQAPHTIPDVRIVEAPYWDVVRSLSEPDFAVLPSDFAFGQVLANYGTSGTSVNFTINAATINDTADFATVGVGHYTATAKLAFGVDDVVDILHIVGARGLSSANIGDYAYLDDECVAITAVNLVAGTITVDRAVLDTVPVKHDPGTQLWFHSNSNDRTTYEAGAFLYYRVAPNTALGSLPLSSINSASILMLGRAEKPYPPGNVKINGIYRPAAITDQLSTISWAHRNRLSQTVSLTPQTAGDITPESGTTYTVAISWAPDLTSALSTPEVHTGITTTGIDQTVFTPINDAVRIHVEINSVRAGIASWQTQVLDFTAVPVTPSDPHWANVTLLLNFNDAAHPYRCAKTGLDWTAGEGAYVDTTTPITGSGSIVFPGYLKYLGFTVMSTSSDDFTYEETIKPTALGGRLFEFNSNDGNAFIIGLNTSGIVFITTYQGGVNQINNGSSTHLVAGNVYRFAIVKNGSEVSVFIDGVKEVVATGISSLNGASLRNWFLGRDSDYADGTNDYFTGSCDEIRFTDGVARYTSDYTPLTTPFPTR